MAEITAIKNKIKSNVYFKKSFFRSSIVKIVNEHPSLRIMSIVLDSIMTIFKIRL